jgi:putative nucleotidyltransferase-like protein
MVKPQASAEADYRPEIELLLCCARTHVGPQVAGRINTLLGGRLDWDYLLRMLLAHGVMPLFHRNVAAVFPETLPKAVIDQTREYFRTHVQRNLFLTGELLRLLRLLTEHGIAALPYKGPVLAASVYGDVSLRDFSDLDILVQKKDILKSRELLISEGYRPRVPLTADQQVARLRSRNRKDFAFISEGSVKVELHWEIAGLALFPLEARRLWERVEHLPLGGTTVLNVAAEDLLLILCVHGAKHFFKRVEWICDIAELLAANPAIRWERVIEQATRLRTRRMLFLGLILANQLLDSKIPDQISRRISADRETKAIAGRVRRSLFSETDSASEMFKRHSHRISLREGFRDRMRLRAYYFGDYFRALVTPNEEDRGVLRLPELLHFLYYLLRPIRLVKLYGLNLLTYMLKHGKS